jgi:hypothetical protein
MGIGGGKQWGVSSRGGSGDMVLGGSDLMKVLLSKPDIWSKVFAKIKTFVPSKNKGTKKK